MTEADTRANRIDPALKDAGWSKELITREYYFTDGRKLAELKHTFTALQHELCHCA